MKSIRILVAADLHCGHRAGLTPPEYRWSENAHDITERKYARIQRVMWDWWCAELDAVKPIDVLICNGDAIDGKGDRSGGSEQIRSDRTVQADMAVECLQVARAPEAHLIYGTPYHTGTEEDFEVNVARALGAEIGAHDWFTKWGVTLDCRHAVSGSTVPHGRHTAIARERLWNVLWSEREAAPKASIILRSHTHYHAVAGGPGWVAMTTPCMQGWTKYGSRACSGTIDIGFVTIDITEDGGYAWALHLLDLRNVAAKAVQLQAAGRRG